MMRQFIYFKLLLACLFFVCLCASRIAFSDPIAVTDYLGQEVILPKPAKRIVALAPHIVENLYSAGAGELIVGAVGYSDYPESAKQIQRVGAVSTFSIETIVALKPDLVIVWHSGQGGQIIHKLVSLGLTVYADNPKTLNDVSRSIRDFGQLAGAEAVAEKVASSFDLKQRMLQRHNKDKSKIDVLYQVWNSPLQTLSGEHIISDIIRLCGGRNVFSNAISLAPKISVESVIQVNPDVIIASGMGESRPEWLDDWRPWKSIKAVKFDNLYFIPPDLIQRHTTRMLEGASMMCEYLDDARVKMLRLP